MNAMETNSRDDKHNSIRQVSDEEDEANNNLEAEEEAVAKSSSILTIPLVDGKSTEAHSNNGEEQQQEQDLESSNAPKPVTPLPKGGLLAVITVIICEGFAFTSLFPFVGFMILDFGLVKDERDAGLYAGLLSGIYSVAQFFSGFVFGALADKLSKRAVVCVSTVGSAICLILFGMSTNLYWALLWRAMAGALNGNLATAKAYLSDITDGSNQSKAFSSIGFSWGIGVVGGPAIGGFLSKPAEKYPKIFGNMKLFIKFPYLLPCLCTVCIMLVGFVLSALFMVPPKKKQESDEPIEDHGDLEMQNAEEGDLISDLQETTDVETTDLPSPVSDKLKSTTQMEEVMEPVKQKPGSIITRIKNLVSTMCSNVLREVHELIFLCKHIEVVITVALYTIVAANDTFLEEMFPLWALIDKSKGGLSFNSTQIGAVQMTAGFLMVFQPFLYPIITKYLFTKLNCCRLGFAIFAVLFVVPLLNVLAQKSQALLICGLGLYTMSRAGTEMLGFTSIFIMMNNAAPTGFSGRVQALSHSMACISRAAAPFAAGPILSFFAHLAEEKSRLLIHAPFFVLSIMSMVAIGLTLLLPVSINEPKTEKVQKQVD